MNQPSLQCIECHRSYSDDALLYTCPACQGLLEVVYDYSEQKADMRRRWSARPVSVWRYRELLPPIDQRHIISLREGGTPLYTIDKIASHLHLNGLFLKNEGANPTGSFKDRGMTVGVSKAIALGMQAVACASTGNTSASMAAYGARAGLRCVVLVPEGKVALGKLSQAVVHGAEVVSIDGNFDQALRLVQEICGRFPVYLLNSVNPFRLEGQKTLAFEVWEQLGNTVPDAVVVPVGNAGNISAIWKGFTELRQMGLTEKLPRMLGVQAERAAPLARSFKSGRDDLTPVRDPETVATAIRIGFPVNWRKALRALRVSDGSMTVVSDQEILSAQKLIARNEGIFVEPASAASIAALPHFLEENVLSSESQAVCIATGHGLKDPAAVLSTLQQKRSVPASVDSIVETLQLTVS